jgi:pyridoxamine 5'-phosphate oxidase
MPLREDEAGADPRALLADWFEQAVAAGTREPEAAAVATATPDGRPSVRMVLVKVIDERGLVFFTNYASRKGGELAANPRAALMFHWDLLGRVVRLEGPVRRVDREETESYVRTRTRASRLSALASPQSSVIENREWLERRVAELAARYEGTELPIAENWGGVLLVPEVFEFWQHREDRLHDRLRYMRLGDGGWLLERLAP